MQRIGRVVANLADDIGIAAVIALANLAQSGDAWAQAHGAVGKERRDPVQATIEGRPFGARPDHGHVALQHIQQLRQLVHPRLAQKRAHPVIRGSRFWANTAPVRASASARIERNFKMANNSVRSAMARPTRIWR